MACAPLMAAAAVMVAVQPAVQPAFQGVPAGGGDCGAAGGAIGSGELPDGRGGLPEPFTLLPLFDLQPAFCHYGATELSVAFQGLGVGEDDETPSGFLTRHLSGEVPPAARRRMHGFKVNSFRSNGIKQVNHIAGKEDRPAFSDADGLREAGYDFADKGTVDAVAQDRGVYTIREGRVDCTPRLPMADNAALVGVDPGVKDVLCFCVCQYQHAGKPVSIVSNSDEVWAVSGNENCEATGADLKAKRDWKRRCRNGGGTAGQSHRSRRRAKGRCG